MGERNAGLGVAIVEREEVVSQPVESLEAQVETEISTDDQENSVEELPSQTYEEVVAEVGAYFGGTIYTFKSYKGTATQIAEQCPMAKMAFMRGTAFAISFIETFGIPEEKEELADEETSDEETDEPKDDTAPTLNTQQAAEKVPEKTAEAKTDTAIARTVMAQVATSAVMQERNDPVAHESVLPVTEAPISEKDRAAEKGESSREEVVSEIETTPLPLPAQKVEVKPKRRERVKAEKREPRKAEPQVEEIETTVDEVELPTVVTEIAGVTPVAAVQEETIAAKEPVREVVTTSKTTTTREQPVVLSEVMEDVAETEVGELQETVDDFRDEFETTVEPMADEIDDEEMMAPSDREDEPEEQAQPTDLYETIADQLGIEQDQPIIVEAIADQTELETTTIAPLLGIIEEIAEQPEENQPLIKQQLVEVVRSIEILKWARSAEECKEAVDGLKTNLTLLLEELGYDEPKLLTIQLLEQYNLQSLDEIMNTALKVARSKKVHAPRLAHIRQLLIGRHVVKLLVGTLSHSPQLQYMSA